MANYASTSETTPDARWLDGLNERQRQAVAHDHGPLLIVAGAGAGKTTVLTRRTARLIAAGEAPHRILVVTFTNKAARELRERLETLVGEGGKSVVAATFHSFVLRHLVRPHGYLIGLDRPAILDEMESRTLFKEACEHLSAQEKQARFDQGWSPSELQAEMGLARAAGLSPQAYRRQIRSSHPDAQFQHQTANAWEHYLRLLERHNALDFDGILEAGVRILEEHEPVRDRMQRRFRHVMVDEYQDTNHIQARLIRQIASRHRNLCVVGDARQSIYRFRGSDIGIILDFQRTWPGARIIELPTNYRSTGAIVTAANRISGSMRQKVGEEEMVAGGHLSHLDDPPRYREHDTDRDEARWIAARIQERIESGIDPSEIAVLYRNRAIKGPVEQALIEARIPYVVIGDTGFFQRKEIRDLMALLRVIGNPSDHLAWLRILDAARIGISATRVREESSATGLGVGEILQARAGRNGKTAQRLRELLDAAATLGESARADATQFHDRLYETWTTYLLPNIHRAVKAQYGKQGEEAMDRATEFRKRNAEQLMRMVRDELGGRAFEEVLEDLVLLSAEQETSEQSAVSLMTIHASKGLEFDHVFLPGIEDAILPGHTADFDEEEEERRIFYVALTRAKKSATLSCARERLLYGQRTSSSPSRFVTEILDALALEDEEREKELQQPAPAAIPEELDGFCVDY